MHLNNVLKNQERFSDILAFPLTKENTVELDFTKKNNALDRIDIKDTTALGDYVNRCIESANAFAGVGGYNEERIIYRRSNLFLDADGIERYIHLGVDLWAKAHTPIFATLEGVVFSIKDNKGFGDYGPTLILKHRLQETDFFTLYGHLSVGSLTGKYTGQKINAGEAFCTIGTPPLNGNWPPHLHFQIIADMLNYTDDFPGVCSLSTRNKFLSLCPDPNIILRIV